MDDNSGQIKQTAINNLNNLFKQTAKYFNLDYQVLIYRLLKNGHVKISDLAKDSGLSEVRLYQIVEKINNLIQNHEEI